MCAQRPNADPGNPADTTGKPSGNDGDRPGSASNPDPARQDAARQDREWRAFVERSRREPKPFEDHLEAFGRIFEGRRPEDGPPVVWSPDEAVRRRSNLQASMAAMGIDRYEDFHTWSVRDPSAFWTHTLERLGIAFTRPPDAILDLAVGVRGSRGVVRDPRSMPRGGVRDPRWLPGAELNIVDSCFTADPGRPAVVTPGSGDPEGLDDPHDPDDPDDPDGPAGQALRTTTYGELESLVNRVANGLTERGLAPDRAIALYMPLNRACVIAYLAIIRAGSRVVSIADSFPASEVRRRMAIAGANCAVTMDRYVHAGKVIPLYETVVEAGASTIIVVPSGGDAIAPGASPAASDAPQHHCGIRASDIPWSDLLSSDDTFESVIGDPYRTTNILFSSGTTGEPKAVPWTHLTPIKSAMDGYFHQDIHGDDVTTWPTNIGWMMGPWLIYATLVNGACMALYPGATNTAEYLRFIRRAGVTVQGVIPSLVRTWRRAGVADERRTGVSDGQQGGVADGIDWPSIRVFSSTGEPASRTDYLWLMSRAGYRAPVIEYLGGTEIGGGHLACTVLQPCSPAAFTTANLGVDFVILDESGEEAGKAGEVGETGGEAGEAREAGEAGKAGKEVGEGETGELFLMPPALGMSQRLLNGDHDEVYYNGCPAGPRGEVLRRHGDHTKRLYHGYYRAQGRADDGMNLGGILVSPLELERIIDGHPAVYESAAVAVQPEGEGAERLVVFVVAEAGAAADADLAADALDSELDTGPGGAAGPGSAGPPADAGPDAQTLTPDLDPAALRLQLQAMVSAGLNPLFRIYRVVIVEELPHTASGKLIRRVLRDMT